MPNFKSTYVIFNLEDLNVPIEFCFMLNITVLILFICKVKLFKSEIYRCFF